MKLKEKSVSWIVIKIKGRLNKFFSPMEWNTSTRDSSEEVHQRTLALYA
jgi:hypothetical protein